MHLEIKPFNTLTLDELYAVLRLRSEIFVVEQQCVYQDLDDKDASALHVMGWEGDRLIGYCRVFRPGDYFEEASLGRVAVQIQHRGKGYGVQIMDFTIDSIEKTIGPCPIAISAQAYLKQFYEDLGFLPEGELYAEDGIPHIRMLLKPKQK